MKATGRKDVCSYIFMLPQRMGNSYYIYNDSFFLCQMLTSCLCIIFTLLYPESPQRSGCCWVIDRHKQAKYLGLGKETLISTPAEWDRGMRFCGEDFIELKKVDSWQMIFFRSSNSPYILSGILRQYDWSVIEKANNPVRAVALSPGTVQPPPREKGGSFQGGNGRGSHGRMKRGMGKFYPPPRTPSRQEGLLGGAFLLFLQKSRG